MGVENEQLEFPWVREYQAGPHSEVWFIEPDDCIVKATWSVKDSKWLWGGHPQAGSNPRMLICPSQLGYEAITNLDSRPEYVVVLGPY